MLREFLAQMLLDLSLALLSFVLYLRRCELLGCISQAQLDSGWVWQRRALKRKWKVAELEKPRYLSLRSTQAASLEIPAFPA